MQRALMVVAGLGWAFFLFVVSFWLTFPGRAVADRVEYEVAEASGGAWMVEVGDISPWWLGGSTGSLKVFSRGAGASGDQLVLYASDARVAFGLGSLVSRQPRASGSVQLGDGGRLDYTVATAMNDAATELRVTEVKAKSDAFPLSELVALIPSNDPLTGTGKLAVDIAIDAPDGLAKANGSMRISGRDLALVSPVVAGFPIGRDVRFSDIDIDLTVDEGRAKIARGRLASDIANVDLSGDIVFADDLSRSRMDARAELTLDESMRMMESMLASAARDGKFHYRCAGPVSRIASICQPDGATRGRVASVTPRGASRPAPVVEPGKETVKLEGTATPGGMGEEERAQRRQELQERLRKRREQREAGGGPVRPGEVSAKEEFVPFEEVEGEVEIEGEGEEEKMIEEEYFEDE